MNVELAIFFALLLVITGTFAILHQTISITGAVINTLPTEETIVESNENFSEQAIEVKNETYAQLETTKKESSSIEIQEISIGAIPRTTLVLNSTNLTLNHTDVNLTAYNTTQTNGTSLKVIYNWLRNATPIAVLNMPFEGINGTTGTIGNSWDYSGLGNNGSENGVVWNSTGGYDGKGAYMFDGVNDYIGFVDTASLNINGSLTLAAWINPRTDATQQEIIWHGSGGVDYDIRRLSTGELRGILANISNTQLPITSTSSIADNAWLHVAVTYNLDENNLSLFINGVLDASTVAPGHGRIRDTGRFEIGNFFPTNNTGFNGTIDEVMVWNRSLSAEQIFALWRNQTYIIVAQETQRGENWTVEATPNNGTGDGIAVTSNNVTILNAKPVISPLILNSTNISRNDTDVNLTVYANTSDIDSDSVKVIYNWLRNNTPIAVLNMPFERINNTVTNNAWDYSGYGNNGSDQGGLVWNATGGFDGKGAYQFDGVNDEIFTVSQTKTALSNNFTLSAWIKPNSVVSSNLQTIMAHGANWNFRIESNAGANPNEIMFTTDGVKDYDSDYIPRNGSWYHVAVVLNSSNDAVFYVNGTAVKTSPGAGVAGATVAAGQFCIGSRCTQRFFNGTIDEVVVFNRSLSAEQIFALYQNQTNVIVSNETAFGENWSVQTTPNDGIEDGAMVLSSNITILDKTVPTVNITFPTNGSNFSARTMFFNASITDSESSISVVLFVFNNGTSNPFNLTASNSSGTWNVTVDTSYLFEGLQGFAVAANDTANNLNYTQFVNFTVDYTGPTITMRYPPVNTYFGYDVVNFNASVSDALLQVNFVYFEFINGTNPFNVTASNISGDWNASVNLSRIAEGRQTLIPRANDTVGNDSGITTLDIFIDRTPPNVTINYNFVDNSNFSIRSSNRTFNVSLSDPNTFPSGVNASYFWFDNGTGKDFNVTAVNQSGEWVSSYNVSTLAEENQGVRIIANDSVRNVNDSFVINFTVDFTSPNVTLNFLNNPVDNSNFSIRSSNRTFNASIFDALIQVDTVYFWFDNGTGKDVNITATNRSGQWSVSYNVSTLIEGKQGVRIFANDSVNNVNSSYFVNFTIDFTAPNISSISHAQGTSVAGSQVFNATFKDNLLDISTVIFQFLNGTIPFNRTAANTSGIWGVTIETVTVEEGALTVTIFANDTVGNMNNTQAFTVTVDNVPDASAGGGGGEGGSSSGTKLNKTAEYACGNGVLENGEQCDLGEGCNSECKCGDGYNSVKEIDCEKVSEKENYCGDGIVNQAIEECDGTDFNERICVTEGYAEGELTCDPQCTIETTKCLVKKSDEGKETTFAKGKALAGKEFFFIENYTDIVQQFPFYILLTIVLILIIIAGLHIKDMPVPEFLGRFKPTPEVKVEEPAIIVPSLEQKPDFHIRDWGRKNYIDLQQELKRVEALIKDTPVPGQKNKISKLTSLQPIQLRQKQSTATQNLQQRSSSLSQEEIEQWIIHLFASGTPTNKVLTIVKGATALSEAEIKPLLIKVRATQLLEKTYQLNQKVVAELRDFIRMERKSGATTEQIVADLQREGWDEKVIRLYVTAHGT